jgi:opacity protein-like surface antigen
MISKKLKTAILAGGVALGSISVASAGVLNRYFDTASTVLPDKLSLGIYETVRYEDNLFSTGSGERGGIVFSTGVSLDASRARGEFSYSLKADVAYDHYHKFASDLSAPVYSVVPMLRYDQGNWDFVLGGNFLHSHTVVDRGSVGGNPRSKYFISGVDATWNLHLNEKWGVAVTADYEHKDHTKSAYNDEDYHKYELSLAPYYVFSPKTKAGISLGYAYKDYTDSQRYADSVTYDVNAFVDYRVTGKISTYASAGAEWVNYTNSADVYKENDPLFNCSLTVRYAMLTNLDLRAGLKHKHADNSGGSSGMQQDTDALLGLTWRINSKLSLAQNFTHKWSDKKDGVTTDNKQISYDATLSYDVTDNLTVYGGYEFGNTDYSNLGVRKADYTTNIYHMGVRYTF